MPMTTRATGHDAGSHVPSLRFLAALLLAAAFVQACATGGGGSAELAGILALVPADSENVVVYDLEQIRGEEAPRALRDEVEDLSEYGLEEMGVLTDELTTLVVASGDDWHLLVVEGDIDFVHVRDQLEDGDYDDDQYRGSELWEGAAWRHESVALLEDQGRMVIGDAETVKRVLRTLESGSGSLSDDADSDLGRALKRAGEGWISSAQEECLGYEIRGCRAAGVSLRRGDSDYLVEITIAALFRNERTAESEMDELESQIEEDSSFEFDIDDVQLDGDFVIVTASADEDDLFEDEDDLSEGQSPVPVTPTVTAMVTPPTPDTRAPDTRDDHGDSADEATFATVGDAVTGVLGHWRDVDYFAFAAERGQTYRIDVDLGTLYDSVAALFDSGSRELEFDDDGGESYGSRITWTAAESGTHYVAVAGFSSDTGSYTLTVTAMRDAPETRAPGTRDDHGDSADEATFATVGDAVTGMVGHGRDVDYFAFAAERGQTYRIDVDLGTLYDSVAALYDSGSRQLDFDDDGGDSFGSRITWTAAESATHYVAVAGWASDTGSYTLTVTAMGDAPDTRDDHGDSADEATFATVGDAVTGVLRHWRDVDYFAFAAERGQTYRIDVDLGTLDDSVAALYDSDSRELEFDDDGGESFGSRITWTAAESGTHYVAVAGWASATGSYTLTVTAMGDAPDTRAPDTGEVTDARASGADTPPEAPSAQRIDFEASTPAGYTAVTLRTGGSVWGVPSRYTTDSNAGVVTYVLLGTVKGCEFADAEAERGSRVYIKTQDLGRLTNFTSERVCQKRTSSWSSWGGRQITHLRFFDESEPTSVGEYVYDAAHGRYVRADGATSAQPATPSGSPPEPPANQRFEYDGAAVVLSWDASSGADSYTVYYDDFFDSNCRLGSRGPSFCEELATNLSGASYTHVRPDPDEHYYWVVACNRFGCSAIDSTNPAQLGGSPPDAPANQRYEYDGAAIVLTWGASSDADSYTVYYDDFSGSSCSLHFGSPSFCEELATDLTVTTFTHADPDARDNYYWVVACNRFGCSEIDSANPARVAP